MGTSYHLGPCLQLSEHTPEMPKDAEESQKASTKECAVGDGSGSAMVFAVAATILSMECAPGSLWLDTGEFGAVSARLSISHPPGHPLHALLTKATQLFLPIGDLGFRSNLLSVVCVAGALSVFYGLLRTLAPRNHPLVHAVFALTPLLFTPVYEQEVRAEVYALQLLLSVALALISWRVSEGEDRRWLPLLALVFGLAGCNHSFIGLYWIPFALFAMWRGESKRREIMAASVSGAFALALYAYLPLRALSGGEVGWGSPDTYARFIDTVTGRAWMHNLLPGDQAPGVIDSISLLAGYVIQHYGVALGVVSLCMIAFAVPAWVRERRGVVLTVFIAAGLPFILRLGNEVDLSNPDLGGYLACGLLAMAGLTALAYEDLSERYSKVLIALLVVSISIQSALALHRVDPSGDRSSERYVRALLAEAPIDGVLITSDYSTTFTAWALRAFEGARPDLGLLYRGQVHQEWHRKRAASALPRLGARLKSYPASFMAQDVRWELGVKLDSLGALRSRLVPVGLSLAADGALPSADQYAAAFRVFEQAGFAGRRFRALMHVHYVEQLRHIGAPADLIDWHLRALAQVAPDDPVTKTLLGR